MALRGSEYIIGFPGPAGPLPHYPRTTLFPSPDAMLTPTDHDRDTAGLTYVYPVISRRARGVSLGINLNVNNACNWACVYCQVPNLTRGGPPPVDLALLERELRSFLERLLHGDFMAREVPEDARRLSDVAFSGNGEPTSSPEFPGAVERVIAVLDDLGIRGEGGANLPIRLITNGSLMHRESARRGVARIGSYGGEVWFKVDRATAAGIAAVNGVNLSPEHQRINLLRCCDLAPTWLQTCVFGRDGRPPEESELQAYVDFAAGVADRIQGIHLYGIARQVMQPGGDHLQRLPAASLDALAGRLKEKGLKVTVSP